MVRAFSSGGSFQGNTVISAFGASEAMSIETWSGCAVTSSGGTSIGARAGTSPHQGRKWSMIERDQNAEVGWLCPIHCGSYPIDRI
jgi:hypothetical protein